MVSDTWSPLTPAERQQLLTLARASIAASARGELSALVEDPSPALCCPAAVFVSLHIDGALRGCIGTMQADRPLHRVVAEMAREAARNDPRFPPVTAAEVLALDIEVSRLGPLRPASPEEVRPGVHGVWVRRGTHCAVFLPQVAIHCGWTREVLLNELCRKAALPASAWHAADIELMIFEAEVFGDAPRA